MIAVIASCFNRRELTLGGLRALQQAMGNLDYRVYLVDDGCTDGTGDAVRAAHPEVTLIAGDGSLYWNGGMRVAWKRAIEDNPSYFLWWNDDLEMAPGALQRLFSRQKELEAQHGPKVISIGEVIDPETGKVTYGGYVRAPGLSALRFQRVPDHKTACVTMNGNCVLIPARAVRDIGILNERFRHGTGDIDYGLRASKAGYAIFQSDFPVGVTAYNHQFEANMSRLTLSNWRFILRHPKGIPVDEWLYFCRSHGGWIWPVNFIVRYASILRLA